MYTEKIHQIIPETNAIKKQRLVLLCCLLLIPQIVGTLLAAPLTVNESVRHCPPVAAI